MRFRRVRRVAVAQLFELCEKRGFWNSTTAFRGKERPMDNAVGDKRTNCEIVVA